MNNRFQRILQILIVVAGIIAYIGVFGAAAKAYWEHGKINDNPDAFVAFANTLAGLVGGIVAVGFGVSPARTADRNLVSRYKLRRLGSIIAAGDLPAATAQEILGLVYAVVYILIGFVAIGIWQFKSSLDPNDIPFTVIKNIATVSLGMFIPIIKGFFAKN